MDDNLRFLNLILMKTSIYRTLLLWFPFVAAAQSDPPYPTQPAAQNILRAEYFFDTDPGFGSGTPIDINTPGTNLADVAADLDISGLPVGIHRLCLRSLSQEGRWSVTYQREILIDGDPAYPEPGSAGDIVKAEYFFTDDPGFGAGTDIPLNAGADLTADLEASIAGFPNGQYQLVIRTLGQNGRWSISYPYSFLYDADPPYPVPATLGNIIYAEYFINDDPGFGGATPIDIEPGTNLSDIPFEVDLTGLADNAHHILFLRMLDDWSVTYAVPFSKGNPLPVTLVNFHALYEAGSVQLYWEVADEVDFEAYAIERSADARNFVHIGRQEALGNQGKTQYSFTDISPLSNQTGYYRLKMIDRAADRTDGTYSYSRIIAVGNRSAGEMVVSPNPIGSHAYITFQSGTDQKVRMEMLSTEGKVMLSKDFDAVKGANRLELQTEFLQQGIYIVRISGSDSAGVKRVVK